MAIEIGNELNPYEFGSAKPEPNELTSRSLSFAPVTHFPACAPGVRRLAPVARDRKPESIVDAGHRSGYPALIPPRELQKGRYEST